MPLVTRMFTSCVRTDGILECKFLSENAHRTCGRLDLVMLKISSACSVRVMVRVRVRVKFVLRVRVRVSSRMAQHT